MPSEFYYQYFSVSSGQEFVKSFSWVILAQGLSPACSWVGGGLEHWRLAEDLPLFLESQGFFFMWSFHVAHLGFLTAWWPQDNWMLLWWLGAPGRQMSQGQETSPFLMQPWRSCTLSSFILSWSQANHILPRVQGEGY